ncbi:N-methyl-L-tryptophan oxidase [Halorubrum sp. F4]|uniref:N-methyl-L-tryptophan oxidase n=1 Tax=Halorubrum sp. F4 TaxID=2989715 RepID=UPI00248044FB|nr:N-methyl-L-tryptophan oxidase [Halorubrum sp. F4]
MTPDETYEVIVVGVGGMGSAATYHLAKRGVDVLGIERYDVPHAHGSSHGESRLLRLPQTKGHEYVPLVKRARDRWLELEDEIGWELFVETGTIGIGPPDGEKIADATAACDRHDVEYETLSAAEIEERFPAYDLPEDYVGIYQDDGGFLASERAVTAHVRRAQAHGGTVHARERVLDWEAVGDGVRVRTDRGTYAADHLVVSSGAWAAKHLDVLSGSLNPERRVMIWVQPEREEHFTPEAFPGFTIRVPEGSYYGFPTYERPGYKFGREPETPEAIDPDDWRTEPTLQDDEFLRRLPENHLPTGNGPTMGMSSCIVTESVDGHFYVDTHPDYPQVSIAAGFSGSGFKFCSVIGESLADLTTTGDTDVPIGKFRVEGRI